MVASPVRVLLVDDQRDVRALLRRALSACGDITVVGEAADGVEAVRLAAELTPDVVVLDLDMPGGRGEEAVPALRREVPGVKIAILSGDTVDEDVQAAADVFLAKGASMRGIVAELVALAGGTPTGA